jgi:Ca-activated chloride channel family protein
MNFVAPSVLYLIPVIMPLIAWFLWWTWRKRQALTRQFVSERLLPQLLEGVSPSRQKLRLVLLALSILFVLLALARPQWGFVWEEASQRGRDILVAIDTSKSMLATDMAPNRLERAKLAALDLLRLAKNDRLGLIAFAGGAFLQSPLTLDDEAFRQNINALDTSIIPQGGTSLSEAIDTAISAFASEEGDNHRVLVIFTDGEDQDEGALQAAEKAAEKNLKIFTVGVGTPAGELIRVTDQNGQTSFIKDSSGNAVKSRLNEDLLRQIATAGNGFYLALREGNAMQTLYQKGLEPMPTSEISSKLVRHLNEQFHWPLGIAVAFLLLEMLLPPVSKKRARAAQPALILILLCLFPFSAQASPARAYRDYKSGHFKDARNEYERLLERKPDDPVLNYNAGAASYKAGAYDAAVKQFSAASRAQDLNLQQSAYYNLGNANFRLGNEESDPQKKMGIWQQALQNFESSLKLNPKDADATFNHDLVKQKLEELKKQQQQQQNQDQKKDDSKDKQQNQDNKQQDKNKNQEQKKDQQSNDNKKDDQQQQEKKDNEQQTSDQQKKEEEKKKQEQQQQQQQQQQQGKDGEDKKDAQQKDQQQQQQANKDERDPQKEAEQEARAAQLGLMTPKQAQQMLDAQKTDERALIYRQPLERRRAREKSLNDW